MEKNYKWGILGAGRIAEKFCTALNFVEGSQVYAVASRDAVKAQEYAVKFKAAKFYDNYEALIDDAEVDVIYIATPHAFHYQHAMACLKNKKAVLCEKPISLSYSQTKEMTDEAGRQGVFFMEGMWTACMPFMDRIRSIIEEGLIGKPQQVTANFGFTAPVDLEGRLYNKLLGGGAMMDVGVYPLYLASAVLGEPAIIKSLSKLSLTGVDEYTGILLQYQNGASAQLLSSITFNTPIEASVMGTKGYISIQNPWFKATEFSLHLNDGTTQNFSMPHECNGFEHEIKEVMYCLDRRLLQSSKVPHSLSLQMSKTVAEVLGQAGIKYN